MNPHDLVAPASPLGYPTPFWFIELFKVLGFSLHVAPMNLWYAGGIIAAVLGTLGKGNARIVGRRIARILPFALAFGINLGIVPLLFLQVGYHQFFYPATILMAWPWFAVFWLVIVGYACTYLYRLSADGNAPAKVGPAAGWLAAIIFIIVGFIFTNAFSLTTRVGGWWGIFRNANVAGAATGLALDTGDPSLIPRWLFMFGLAITTTAAFIAVDAAFLASRENDDYRRYALRFAGVLYTIGLLWFVGFGSWYIFGAREFAVHLAFTNPVMRLIFPLTAVSPGLPWLLILAQQKGPKRVLAVLTGLAQFGVIVLNAVSRQWLQNVELSPYVNLAKHAVDPQMTGIIVFLVMFVGGVALVAWMISKALEASRTQQGLA